MPLGANKAAIMGVAGVSTGDVVLLSSQTADDDATISFTSDITSTYGEYIFGFYNINPATDNNKLSFQVNASGGSGYNETIQSAMFRNYHYENDSNQSMEEWTSSDGQSNGTAFQPIAPNLGNDADQHAVGCLHLFNPSSSTYVKHFIAKMQYSQQLDISEIMWTGGYINTTTAITEVQFKMASGNFDGTIKMWGVK